MTAAHASVEIQPMAPKTTAYLIWDGITPAGGALGGCNGGLALLAAQGLPPDPPLPPPPVHHGHHGHGGAVVLIPHAQRVSVRIHSLDAWFAPGRDRLAIRVQLKRVAQIGSLLVRVYRNTAPGTALAGGNIVYEEILTQAEIAALPNAPPGVPAPAAAGTAMTPAESPLRVRIWVSRRARVFVPLLGTGNEPGAVARGECVHDQAGPAWGKAGVKSIKRKFRLGDNPFSDRARRRLVGLDAIGVNTTEVHQLDARVAMLTAYTAEAPDNSRMPRGRRARTSLLFEALDRAVAEVAQAPFNDPPHVLKIFMATEWFFKDDPFFDEATKDAIRDEIRDRSRDYPEWLILPGSIYWAETVAGPCARCPGALNHGGATVHVYNTLVAVASGRVLAEYHKQHDGGDLPGGGGVMPLQLVNENAMAALTLATEWGADMVGGVVPPRRAYAGHPGSTSGRFTFDGLECALEICADTSYITAVRGYEAAHPGGLGLDLHLVVAAGIPESSPHATLARLNGYHLLCNAAASDGGNRGNASFVNQVNARVGSVAVSAGNALAGVGGQVTLNRFTIVGAPADREVRDFGPTPAGRPFDAPVKRLHIYRTRLQFPALCRHKL